MGWLAGGLFAVGSALLALYDLWKIADLTGAQLHGPALGTDFLNLYAGTSLLWLAPAATYDLDAQLFLQQALMGWDHPIVPFYLPPPAALALIWLAWLPYGAAYLVWLLLGVAAIVLAAWLLAPRGRGGWHFWAAASPLFLPVVLAWGQGQTPPLGLLCFALLTRGLLADPGTARTTALGALGLMVKPQLAAAHWLALLLTRRWRPLVAAALALLALTVPAAMRLGPAGLAGYQALTRDKLTEALWADPTFLPGPTLLHASHWFLGVSWPSNVLGLVLSCVAIACLVLVWRDGLAPGDSRLVQLAVLPLVSVVAAPYALVHELVVWLGSAWLLWRYAATRPALRPLLLAFGLAIWVAANVGVGNALVGGADVAALLGLALVLVLTRQFLRERASHPR